MYVQSKRKTRTTMCIFSSEAILLLKMPVLMSVIHSIGEDRTLKVLLTNEHPVFHISGQ